MKFFSQLIKIKHLSSRAILMLLVDPFVLEPTIEDSTQGITYNVDITLTTTDVIPDSFIGKPFNCSVFLNGNNIRFGDNDYPARCLINKFLTYYQVKITTKQPNSII